MAPRIRSIAQIRQELNAKQRQLDRLQSRRNAMVAQLEEVDGQIASLAGAHHGRPQKVVRLKKKGAAGRRRRSATGKPLVSYLQAILKKVPKGMRVKDACTAVSKAGYSSHSKDFYGIVAAALRDTASFRRVGRGVYKLKG